MPDLRCHLWTLSGNCTGLSEKTDHRAANNVIRDLRPARRRRGKIIPGVRFAPSLCRIDALVPRASNQNLQL